MATQLCFKDRRGYLEGPRSSGLTVGAGWLQMGPHICMFKTHVDISRVLKFRA